MPSCQNPPSLSNTHEFRSLPNSRAYSDLCTDVPAVQIPASVLVPPTLAATIFQRYVPDTMGSVLMTPALQLTSDDTRNLATARLSLSVVSGLLCAPSHVHGTRQDTLLPAASAAAAASPDTFSISLRWPLQSL